MRLHRIISATLGAALLGVVPVALIASPASAATAYQGWVSAQSSPAGVFAYGDTITISGNVKNGSDAGATIPETTGQVTLHRRNAGSSTWTLLATDTTESSFYFTTKSLGTAEYAVVFNGGTNSANGDTYASDSVSTVLKAKRKLTLSGMSQSGRLYIYGKVTPNYGNRTVIVQRRSCGTCSWVKVDSDTTNAYGNYKVRVYAPRSGSWYYRTVVPAQTPRWYASTSTNSIRTYRS